MPSRKLDLSAEEIARPFQGPLADQFPPILTKQQAATLLATNVKTLSVWMAFGHLDGSYNRRGKACRFWRDRLIEVFFNRKDWA